MMIDKTLPTYENPRVQLQFNLQIYTVDLFLHDLLREGHIYILCNNW